MLSVSHVYIYIYIYISKLEWCKHRVSGTWLQSISCLCNHWTNSALMIPSWHYILFILLANNLEDYRITKALIGVGVPASVQLADKDKTGCHSIQTSLNWSWYSYTNTSSQRPTANYNPDNRLAHVSIIEHPYVP